MIGLPYGLAKRLKRGVAISMSLTYRCNIKCPYCSIAIPTGKMPRSKESTLDQLKEAVEKFPYKIREVYITGGSPEMHPDFVEFVTWLIDRKIFVNLFTNLIAWDKIMQLPKSRRLILTASYHHIDDWKQCTEAEYSMIYTQVCKRHRVNVEEIETQLLTYSKVKSFSTEEGLKSNNKVIRFSPDLKMFSTCWDIYSSYEKKSDHIRNTS